MKASKLPYIAEKWKVFIIVSFIISSLYTFPSLMLLREIARLANADTFFGIGSGKAIYLFFNAFFVSMFLFFFYDNWKSKSLIGFKPIFVKRLISFAIIFFILIIISFLSVAISLNIFEVTSERGFFVMNLYRNFMILGVVFLTDYALGIFAVKKNQEIKILNLQNEKIEQELNVLKSQINPHYLFNSLSSLTTLIRENPNEAINFVNHFSDTFRYVLMQKENSLVTLESEIKFLDSYIYMMEKRFENKFTYQVTEQVKKLKSHIPQFSLQLLVENAFKHNRLSKKKPLHISISNENDYVVVTNNVLEKKENSEGFGIGLDNLSKRYQLLSEKDININQSENHFEVRLPLL